MLNIIQKLTLGLWLLGAVYWTLRAFGNKRTRRRQALLMPSLVGIVIIATLIWVELNFYYILARKFIPADPIFAFAGISCVAIGIIFAIWARVTIGRNWSGHVTIKEDHVLIRQGPYSMVRHPIYSGLLLALIGTVIVFRQYQGLIILGYVSIALIYKSQIEERFMIEEFGDAYRIYRQHVKAFIPYVY